MKQRFYPLTRDLHLYLGLFISPFVLLFAITVFFLVHGWAPAAKRLPETRAVRLALPEGVEKLAGRAQIEALRPPLAAAGITGEFGFVQVIPREHRLVFTVTVPGRQTAVDADLVSHNATVTRRTTGFWDALIALHMFPGQHLAAIRMNWPYMRVWRWLADATVYLVLFVSASGIYLWTVLQAERRVGLALLAAGAITFLGIIYGVCV